jgi:hypothetical protein
MLSSEGLVARDARNGSDLAAVTVEGETPAWRRLVDRKRDVIDGGGHGGRVREHCRADRSRTI